MPEKNLSKTIYKKYGSFMIRKAQRALSEQGTIPDEENVSEWIERQTRASRRKEKQKSRIQTYGVPQ